MRTEQWRVITEAPDYEVSDVGRVRRCVPDWQGKYLGRILKPGFMRGYARYVLCVSGRHINRGAHTLVCTAFNGPKPNPKLHCAHRDGDTSNNTPGNLYWATPQENVDDRERHGRTHRGPRSAEAIAKLSRGDQHWTRKTPERVIKGDAHYSRRHPHKVPRGSARHHTKLTEEQVREIRAHPASFGSGRILSERYGVSMGLISAIRNGRAWSHVR